MTIVHGAALRWTERFPALVYGYGGYGVSLSPGFLDNIYWSPGYSRAYTFVVTNLRAARSMVSRGIGPET